MTQALTHLPVATVRCQGNVDLVAAQLAARDLLDALGVELTDESVRDTPRRMARMYAELLTPASFTPTTFPNDGGYDELVVATGIPFHSNVRAPPAAVRRRGARRLPAGRADHRALQARACR